MNKHEEYLNLNCGGCPFLCNDEHSSGCCAPFPIDHCEVFNRAMEEESKKRRSVGAKTCESEVIS